MWHVLTEPLNDDLRRRIAEPVHQWIAARGVDPDRHFDSGSKSFFTAKRAHMGLLHELVSQDFVRSFAATRLRNPVVQHAYPLIKPPGGPATTYHQDRAFWRKFDNPVSMFTLWFALDDVTIENGCLRMASGPGGDEYVEHEVLKIRGGSTYALPDQAALEARAADVQMSAGDVVFFDSLQVHGARRNSSDHHRLALKLVFAERSSLTNRAPYFDLRDLGRTSFFYRNAASNALSSAKQALKRGAKRVLGRADV